MLLRAIQQKKGRIWNGLWGALSICEDERWDAMKIPTSFDGRGRVLINKIDQRTDTETGFCGRVCSREGISLRKKKETMAQDYSYFSSVANTVPITLL